MMTNGNFGKPRDLPPADPVVPTHMHLEIERIKPYEHNPRRRRNSMYAQIKASILAKRGLDDPLGITRRPGEERYTVRAGGNTRLSILKELLEETGDSAFERAHCIFTPWISESDCIAAHLIENELRGELVFIDKALAIKRLMDQLRQETETTLSRNRLLEKLAEMGFLVSKRQLIRYEYASVVLQPLIPEALSEGLGVRRIDEIRDAEKRYAEYWTACDLKEKDFDSLFRSTLAAHDSDGWSLSPALEDLEAKISEITEKSINAVRLELDASTSDQGSVSPADEDRPRLKLIEPSSASFDPMNADQTVSTPSSGDGIDANASPEDTGSTDNGLPFAEQRSDEEFEELETGRDSDAVDSRDTNHGSALNKTSEYPNVDQEDPGRVDSDIDPDQQIVPDPTESSSRSAFLSESLNEAEAKQPRGTDLKSLRGRAYVLATRFAQTFEHPSVVQPSTNGYGFFLEIPKRPLFETGDVARWGWWLLFSLSEQAVTKARLELAPSTMRLPELLIEDRLGEAFALIGDPPDAIQNLGHVFFSSPDLSEQGFRDLLMLIETCRILRNHFPENTLWLCPTIDQLSSQGEWK